MPVPYRTRRLRRNRFGFIGRAGSGINGGTGAPAEEMSLSLIGGYRGRTFVMGQFGGVRNFGICTFGAGIDAPRLQRI